MGDRWINVCTRCWDGPVNVDDFYERRDTVR